METRTDSFSAPPSAEVRYVTADEWSTIRKLSIVALSYVVVLNSTLNSSLPSAALPAISAEFSASHSYLLLSISVYLLGNVLGPTIFSPLSETYGRRPVLLSAFAIYTAFTFSCAAATNAPTFLLLRFFTGVGASAPISISGGLYADLYADPVPRGRCVAFMMAITTIGPPLAPVIAGYMADAWRWSFWTAGILAVVSGVGLLFLPETYAPVLNARRTKALGGAVEKRISVTQVVTTTLTRPLRMLFTEPIVGFTSLLLAFLYGIFYLIFEAYAIIFQALGVYNFTPGQTGLAFIPIAIGALASGFALLLYDHLLARSRHRRVPWALLEESRRLPLACIGGPIYVLSLFWLAWTATADIPPIVPILSGFAFGLGMELTFIALLNYVCDAYLTYAASAMAAGSMSRSLFGAALVLAAESLYDSLGIRWATTLLGGISAVLAIVPFVLVKYGERIRARSSFSVELQMKRGEEVAARMAEKEVVEA